MFRIFWLATMVCFISPIAQALTSLEGDWKISKEIYNKDSGQWQLVNTEELSKQEVGKPVVHQDKNQKIIVNFEKDFQLEDNDGRQVLWLKNPLGHVTVKINDKIIAEKGDSFGDGTKGGRGDLFVNMPSENNFNLKITVDNSAYSPRDTGFYITPVMGSHLEVQGDRYLTLVSDIFLLGFLFITSIYHLMLFFLRTENKSTLIFGLFTTVTMIRMLTAGDSRLFLNMSDVPTTWTYYLENFLSVFGGLLVAYYPVLVLKEERFRFVTFNYKWAYLPIGLLATGSILTLVPVPKISDIGLLAVQLGAPVIILTLIPWMVAAWVRRQSQAWMILFGYLAPIVTAISDIICFFLGINLTIQPIGMALFVVFQAGMLSIRFNNLFDEVDDLNENLERKVEEKTRDIRSTLDNIPQGVFRILGKNDDLWIDDEYSAGLRDIMNVDDIAGKDPFEAVFNKWDLQSVELANIRQGLTIPLGDELFQFDVNSHLLPEEATMGNTILEVDFSPIAGENDTIEKILCVVKNVTHLRELQNQALKEAEGAMIIRELARIRSYKKVHEFLNTSTEYLDEAVSKISDSELVFRNLHTIKGLAMTFDFKKLGTLAHESESLIQKLRNSDSDLNCDEVIQSIMLIKEQLDLYRDQLEALYGHDKSSVSVSKDDLRHLIKMVEKGESIQVIEKITFMYEHNLAKTLESEVASCRELASRLGKEAPEVVFKNDKFILNSNLRKTIKNCFVHLLRNSVDHGLETAEERKKQGKNSQGTITMSVKKENDQIFIAFQDDGRGLDLATLRHKFQERFNRKEKNYEELMKLIFESGVSTAKEVSEISGRGVGMDAVKKFIELQGGKVSFGFGEEKNNYIPFTLKIFLPFSQPPTANVA